MDLVRQVELPSLVVPVGQAHGFCSSCALIEQRGVRHVQASELGNKRLIVEQRFESTLSDLRLIGRVLCGPAGILENVTHYRVGHMAVVVSHADVRAPQLILERDVPNALY